MKRFAIALIILLAAMCVAGSAVAQSSVADQLRALRAQRSGAAAQKNTAWNALATLKPISA